MKSVRLGKLRINVDHLVWYSPENTPTDAQDEIKPGIALKTTDSPASLCVQYVSIEARDVDLAMLDGIFNLEHSKPTLPGTASVAYAEKFDDGRS